MSPWPEEKFNFKKPRNRYEWSIWVGAGLILITQIVKFIVVPSMPSLPEARLFVFFSSLIGWSLLATALLLAGIQLMRLGNKSKKGRIIVIVAILLFLVKIASTVICSYSMSYMVAAGTQMSRQAGESIPNDLSRPDISAVSRAEFGKMLAQIKYIQDGIIMDYIDESGARVVFKPADEDIALRNGRITLITAVRYEKMLIVYWSMLLIATAAVGLLRKKQSSGQNGVRLQN